MSPTLPSRRSLPFLLAGAAGLLAAPRLAVAAESTYYAETVKLNEIMARHVGNRRAPAGPADERRIALTRAALERAGKSPSAPELVLVADRDPRVQEVSVIAMHPDERLSRVIGVGRTSTGNTGRFDYYVTPLGVFPHDVSILGYRAQGTPNEHGIRGLGARGMRVWDLGWQPARRGWASATEVSPIRLMVHATDPSHLETRLGTVNSKGCIRVISAMNTFLDVYGVLDRTYEKEALTDRRFAGLLRRDRTPTPLAGNLVVVIDSSGDMRT